MGYGETEENGHCRYKTALVHALRVVFVLSLAGCMVTTATLQSMDQMVGEPLLKCSGRKNSPLGTFIPTVLNRCRLAIYES